MKSGILMFLMVAGIANAKESAPAEAAKNPLVQVTLEYIEVTQEEVTRLLYKEKMGKDGARLRVELQTMMESGRAKPFETLMASTSVDPGPSVRKAT